MSAPRLLATIVAHVTDDGEAIVRTAKTRGENGEIALRHAVQATAQIVADDIGLNGLTITERLEPVVTESSIINADELG